MPKLIERLGFKKPSKLLGKSKNGETMNKNRTEQDSYKRYGKPSAALLNLKTSFFEENELHLKKAEANCVNL